MKETLLFERLMENVSESVFFKDIDSRFIKINKACAEKFGLEDPGQAVGKTDFDFFDEDHARPALEDEQLILQEKKPLLDKVEKEVFKEDGKVAWVSTSKFPLFDENNELVGTYGITKDVTIQKEIEGKLIENTQRFSKLFEQVPGLFYLFKYKGPGQSSIPFASEAIEEIYELTPEQVQESTEPVMKRVHPDDLNRVVVSIRNSVTKLKTWDCEFRVILPERGIRWLHGKAKPEQQLDGSVIGYGYVIDITAEKKAVEVQKKLRKQFEAVFDSVPNLIFVKDEDGKYIMANKAAQKFFGRKDSYLIGKTDSDLGISKEKEQYFRGLDQKVIRTGHCVLIPEDVSTTGSGEEVWHQTIKVPFRLVDSDKDAVLSIVTDVTERKRNEMELKESLDIISEQNKRLNNFAHIVSHNLRNHAGNISMLLSMYDEEETEEERSELLSYLRMGSKRLNDTIKDLNEIIDQQYKNEVKVEEVNLQEFVDKTKVVLTTEILKHKVEINEQIEDGLTLSYNPAYLESILLNLMSNAIKYRHPDRTPEIAIKAERAGESVMLEVADNGKGLDLEKHGEALFGMYKTFHGNENSKGIGLFITKNQIESLGGTIEVESEPGKGTAFKIKLK